MPWTIDYTESAKRQLRKLDKQAARRILDFMDERIAIQEDPRSAGKALTGPMLGAYPSALLLGHTGTKAIHVVYADDVEESIRIIITVYEPDTEIWCDDFKTRR